MKKRNLGINAKGSFTVEASIVFSVVFLITAFLIYAFIIIYQYAVLQSTANKAANAGSTYYVNKYSRDFYLQPEVNLYWRLVDNGSENKKNVLANYIDESMKETIIKTDKTVDINTSCDFLAKQLKIGINERFPLPAGSIFGIFGLPSVLALKAEAVSPLDDNTEFVRNLDLVMDIKNCIFNFDNKWTGEGSKTNDIIDQLLKKH